jgi:hypothetical protein
LRLVELSCRAEERRLNGWEDAMTMTWMIGRQEALADPLAARRKVMERLRNLTELEEPEAQVVPILIDAILLAETYRGARHPMPFVDELIHSVDALLRELTITEKAKEFVDA